MREECEVHFPSTLNISDEVASTRLVTVTAFVGGYIIPEIIAIYNIIVISRSFYSSAIMII